jgi:hypothetical protein
MDHCLGDPQFLICSFVLVVLEVGSQFYLPRCAPVDWLIRRHGSYLIGSNNKYLIS